MEDRPLELADIRYRLYRNRRIILVSAMLAATGPALSGLVAGTGTFFTDMPVLLALAACWTALMALLIVRFPNGWMDPIALSVALIPFTAATPLYEQLFDMAKGDRQIFGAIWMVFLVSFGWFFTYLGVIWVMCNILPGYRLGERRSRGRVKSDLPPERLFDAVTLRPETSNVLRTTGAVDEDGFFNVTIHSRMPNTDDFELGDWSSDYRAKILERDGLRQVSMAVVEAPDGNMSTSVQVETCRRGGKGSVFEIEEVHDHFDLLSGLGFWLQDFGSDAHQADLELLEDRPKRAIRFASHDSFLTVLARLFKARKAGEGPRI